MGGDEFIILLNDFSDINLIYIVVKNIMRMFNNPFKLSDQEFFVTASAGVAVFPHDGEDCETLLRNADIAMQKAKAGDTNQYALCTKEMKDDVHRNMLLSNRPLPCA